MILERGCCRTVEGQQIARDALVERADALAAAEVAFSESFLLAKATQRDVTDRTAEHMATVSTKAGLTKARAEYLIAKKDYESG